MEVAPCLLESRSRSEPKIVERCANSGTGLNRLPDAGRPWRARVPAATLLLCRNTDRRYLPEADAQRARDKFPAGLTAGTDHTDRLHPALHPNSVPAISNRQ